MSLCCQKHEWSSTQIKKKKKRFINTPVAIKYQYISPRGSETLHLGVEHISRKAVWTMKVLMDRQITVHTHGKEPKRQRESTTVNNVFIWLTAACQRFGDSFCMSWQQLWILSTHLSGKPYLDTCTQPTNHIAHWCIKGMSFHLLLSFKDTKTLGHWEKTFRSALLPKSEILIEASFAYKSIQVQMSRKTHLQLSGLTQPVSEGEGWRSKIQENTTWKKRRWSSVKQ